MFKLAALSLLALGVLVPAAGQGPGSGADLSAVLNSPGSLQARLRFEHLTTADGLSNDSVFSILQDRRGFMWFGTQAGLNRYDGYRVTQYRFDPKNPNSLGDDFVQTLFEDSRGGIWSGRYFPSRFDPDTETFTRYTLPADDTPPFAGTIALIDEDQHGAIWVGCTIAPNLYRLDPGSATFRKSDVGHRWPTYRDLAGISWIGNGQGLIRLDPATGAGIPYRLNPPGSVAEIAADQPGSLWLTANLSMLALFDLATRTFKGTWTIMPPQAAGRRIQALRPDPGGTVWLGTYLEGLKVFDPRNATVRNLRNDPADRYSLSGNEVFSIVRDRESNLWVGVKGGGVNRLSPRSTTFGAWRKDPGDPAGLSDNNVRAILGDKAGNVWLGTYDGGLDRFDPASGKFVHYGHDPRNPRSLDNDRVYSLYEDRSGTLWVGTVNGINRFDRKSGTFEHFSRAPQTGGPYYYFLEDRTGRFWFGPSNLLDRNTGAMTAEHNAGDLSVHEDRNGNLWFATVTELEKMDPAGKRHKVTLATLPGDGRPGPVQVNFFHEDSAGILWLATETGLVRLDPKTEQYATYTTQEGLPDNVVQCILPDRAGNLWVSTNNGLSRFNPRENSFDNFHESDGLQGEQFNRKACFQDAAGLMYFGGIHGFNVFDPSQVRTRPPATPPLVLTEFQIHGRTVPVRPGSVLPRPIWKMDALKLSYRENGFSFEFAALSYAAPARTRYRFRLKGSETEWTVVDSRHRVVRYTDLPPGEYNFQVQASTDGRTWGEQGTSLGISITPPWWMTPWSRGGAALALAGLLFGAYYWRVKAMRKREVQLEALVEQRTAELVEARDQAQAANRAKSTFLSNMSHELRTPLNSILGFSNLLRDDDGISGEQRKDLDIINRSGEHLLGLINDVLDVAKIEAGRIALENTPCDLKSLVCDVAEMMQVRATAKNLQLLVDESAGFPRFVRADASKLREILINLIVNAIKFTERGTVILRLDGSPEDSSNRVLLKFEIEDTGMGIAAEDQAGIFEAFAQVGGLAAQRSTGHGTGLGLTIVKQYVELMGGSIRVESVPGQGSRFYVELPLERAAEAEVAPPRDDRKVAGIEPGQQEYRILVVEDDFESRLLLQRLLTDAGFPVRVAEVGEAGIEMFQSWRPHFIWMDRRMPGIDGLEAVRRIRALEGGRGVKIAAVTASVLAGLRNEMLETGLDDFIRKPYRPAEIFNCMARHLGVRYVYAEDASESAARARAALRPEALAALPEEMREELSNAIRALDAERIARLVHRISEVDPALGAVLAQFADRLAYTPVLRALRAGNGKVVPGSV